MKQFQQRLALLLAAVLLLGGMTTTLAASAPAFGDVPAAHWAADAVAEMAEQGIVNGFPDGLFHPDETLTRAQFLAMVVRATAPEAVPATGPEHDWWWNDLAVAQEELHLDWEPSPSYMNAAIPRQEAADLLVRANESWNGLYATDDAAAAFTDLLPEAYAASISSAVSQGLLEGYPDGTFRPAGALTRAEGCTLVQRLLSRKGLLAEGEIPVVNHGDWMITFRLDSDGAVLTSVDLADGQVMQTMTCPVDAQMLEQMPWLSWRDTLHEQRADAGDGCFWGPIGYFTYAADGSFTQLTGRAVVDWQSDPAGDGILAISLQPGTVAAFAGGGVMQLAGNEVVRIAADGAVETLLANTPAHGLNLTSLTADADGALRVTHTFVMGMADTHSYEYAVEDGKLRALVHEPGAGFSGYTEEEAAAEQARLDAAGCGIGS